MPSATFGTKITKNKTFTATHMIGNDHGGNNSYMCDEATSL